MMDLKDVPSEVYWVWCCNQSPWGVGRKTYDECQRIIDKYPDWFPWEHIYKSIPKEVHDAYFNEKYPDWDKPLDFSGKGLLAESEPIVWPSKDPLGDMQRFFENIDKQQLEEIEKRKKSKKLWDKYYKPYKLEYRERT